MHIDFGPCTHPQDILKQKGIKGLVNTLRSFPFMNSSEICKSLEKIYEKENNVYQSHPFPPWNGMDCCLRRRQEYCATGKNP